MRTTVDLDEDILRAAKELSQVRSQSLGRILSDLARLAMRPNPASPTMRNGVPVLPRIPGGRQVTSQDVQRLSEQED
jgi:hypothetical protein